MVRFLKSAGWSSLVARQAHNLKVAGSNPAPATKFGPILGEELPICKTLILWTLGSKKHGISQQNLGISFNEDRARKHDYAQLQ